MAGISIKVTGDLAEIIAPAEMLAGHRGKLALARALNHTLAKAETAVSRVLVKQTGLKYGAIRKEIKSFKATAGKLEGEIKGQGPYHKLKDFGPRKTRRGISAAPWGERKVFKGTFFMRGGVFKRIGAGRFPVKALYGPAVPKEMARDDALAAFEQTVTIHFPARVRHELAWILRGG